MNPFLRKALIGAAIAVVVTGGTVGGLALAGAGGSGQPISTATTSTSTTTSSTTTTTVQSTTTSASTTTSSTTTSTTTTAPSGPAGGAVPTGFAPASVTFVSPSDGWVLGSAPCSNPVCTSVARTTDGGAHWKGIPAPAAPLASGGIASGNGVSHLVFADALDGFAYGPSLWSTHDGGATWHHLALPAGATAITDLVASGGEVYAVTSTNQGSGAPVFLRASAKSDSFTPVGKAPAATLPALAAAGGVAWALSAGSFQSIPASGNQVASLPDPCGSAPGGGVISAWSATQLAVACAGPGGLGSMSKTVKVSTDGGHSFSATAANPPAAGDLEGVATNGGTVVVSASSGASYLYATFDGGHTWATPYSDASGGAPFTDLGFTDPTQAVAIEGVAGTGRQPFLVMSTDGGHSWHKVAISG